MKANSAISTLFFFSVLPSALSYTLGECKTACKEIRADVLAVKGHCMPAMKQAPTPNLFNVCVEGRKKAFDQACVPMCTKSELSVSSFQGCQASVKNKSHKFVSWCRKGYDSILQNLEATLTERWEKVKQDELEQTSNTEEGAVEEEKEEVVPLLQNARNLINEEPILQNDSLVSKNDPIVDESVHGGSLLIEEGTEVAANEFKGGLRGAYDESEGSESVNDDIVLFEHESHEEDGSAVTHMENVASSLNDKETNIDETVFESTIEL